MKLNLENLKFYLYNYLFLYSLYLSYKYFVSTVFGYMGYIYDPNFSKGVLSILIFSFFLFLTNPKFNKVSSFVKYFYFIFIFGPVLVYFALANLSYKTVLIITFMTALIFFFSSLNLKIHISFLKFDKNILYLSIFSIVIFTILLGYSKGLFNYFNLDERITGLIREQKAVPKAGMSYIINYCAIVFVPSLLAYSLLKKNYFQSILFIFIAIIFFGLTSMKSFFFYPFMILTMYFIFSKKNDLRVIPFYLSILLTFFLLLYLLFDDILFAGLINRRIFFVPPFLTFVYYDFFSNNPHIYWSSNKFISNFISYPYDHDYPNLIGRFLGNDKSHANNSFISTGYMHAGMLGIILYSFLFSIILKLIDSISENNSHPLWLNISFIIVPIQILITSSDLITSLLSGGLALSIILLYLASSKKKN